MEPDSKQPDPTPEAPKGPAPIEPTPQPIPAVEPTPADTSSLPTTAEITPEPEKDTINLAQPDSGPAVEPAATPAKKKPILKIIFVIIAIIVLVIGGILISTFLLAPNLFKATAPSQEDTTTTTTETTTTNSTSNTKTAADEVLTQDILKAIYVSEAAKQTLSSNEVVITEVKTISNTGGVITEEWSIDIGGVKSVYTVVIKPSASGGTDFGVVKKS